MAGAIALLAFAILYGDAFSAFLGGSVVNVGSFLLDVTGYLAYPIAMLLASLVLIGPFHYYADYNLIDVIIIMLFVFFILGFALSRMFKHPGWAFIAGFVVMGSFNFTVYTTLNSIDYFLDSLIALPFDLRGIVFGFLQGAFNVDSTESLFFLSSMENGAVLGLFSFFWSVLLLPSKKKVAFDPSKNCDIGEICKL
jgi:hypothetical protein